MRILFVAGNYLPGKNAGIENYTHWLAKLLLRNGCAVEVAALHPTEPGDYVYETIPVHNLRGSISSFETVIKKGNFDICHFQEYSEFGGIELPWFLKAKEYVSRVFFTFHRPYFTCYKGDFRYRGLTDCETFNDPARCSDCIIADRIGYRENSFQQLKLNAVVTALTLTGTKSNLRNRVIAKHQKLNELLAVCDEVFVYADWFKHLLTANGYGVNSVKKLPYKSKTSAPDHVLTTAGLKNRMLFVGRIECQKGLHLLCEAMNKLRKTSIELDVFGDIVDKEYFEKCMESYAFNFKGTVPYLELLRILDGYDFLVLPSVFTEMYSLVIKDAFYERLPVIASSAKGNRDAISHGVNGFLFEYNNSGDLAVTIDSAYQIMKEGWKPDFTYTMDPEGDIREIVSYYLNN